MKQLGKGLIFAAIVYACFAFIEGEFNIENWNVYFRTIEVFLVAAIIFEFVLGFGKDKD